MNFQTTGNFEQQLSTLLAFVILFEKQIDQLREKLAGNEEFHTRLVFQRMDLNRKGQIRPEDFLYTLGEKQRNISLETCQSFCRKHSVTGALSYDQLLKVITPKNHKILAQRLLVRSAKRGATLPNYLWRYCCDMFNNLIKMTKVTQQIRHKIQNLKINLSHLDMVQFFRKCLLSSDKLWHFCNVNSASGEYAFEVQDTIYLSNHIKSGNLLAQMTDEDIKEIICPLDMNFQKTVKQMGMYYQNLKNQKMKTVNGGFYQPQQKTKSSEGYINFLNATYRKAFQEKPLQNYHPNIPSSPRRHQERPQINKKHNIFSQRQNPIPSMNFGGTNYDNMLIDNFIKPSNRNSIQGSRAIQLDKFLINHSNSRRRPNIEKFEDDLHYNQSNSQVDESGSAFILY